MAGRVAGRVEDRLGNWVTVRVGVLLGRGGG